MVQFLQKSPPKKIQGVSTRDFKMGGANVGEAERLTKNVCVSVKDLTRISRIFFERPTTELKFFASQKFSRFLCCSNNSCHENVHHFWVFTKPPKIPITRREILPKAATLTKILTLYTPGKLICPPKKGLYISIGNTSSNH